MFKDLLLLYLLSARYAPERAEPSELAPANPLPHVAWMLNNMPDETESPEKFHRWLGFVQGVLWSQRIFTIDQLRTDVLNV